MENELMLRDYSDAVKVRTSGENYLVSFGAKNLKLTRDVDFGKIPGTGRPSLLKSGAERIVMSLGLSQRYEIESCIEDFETENPFAFYRVKCKLYYTRPDGLEVTVTEGVGSANTRERQCGRANPYDTANARLKMAKKRAMVDACLTVGQLSSMFSQDMEDEAFMAKAENPIAVDVETPITAKQVKRMFAIASKGGVDKTKCAEIIKAHGYDTSKDIKQKDYDAICTAIEEAAGIIEV